MGEDLVGWGTSLQDKTGAKPCLVGGQTSLAGDQPFLRWSATALLLFSQLTLGVQNKEGSTASAHLTDQTAETIVRPHSDTWGCAAAK
ncbi:hypothetical protein RRG08_036180 [Elysia crispata]|uniref:Uncharacterized protein n=1 Tax=Elysia crispata TaxID=231223 RepID=A0AAE0XE67_9GAST|nr:hypothetical protein RRG08_036180 [Elysia crispata]